MSAPPSSVGAVLLRTLRKTASLKTVLKVNHMKISQVPDITPEDLTINMIKLSIYSLFFRSTTENESECKAEIVVPFTTDIELCHKSNMVDKLNSNSWRKKH